MNRVTLVGRLGSAIELKYTPGGAAVASVSLATSEYHKDKQSGERKQTTEWHRVVFWNRLAEIANEFTGKGSQVLVEGKLKTRSWDDHGTTRYTTEVVATELELLGSRSDSSGGAAAPSRERTQPAASGPGVPDNFAGYEDDIPF